jgi:hypothetical protein
MKLECSTDYEVFESHELNRNLRDLSTLKLSMQFHGFRPSSPIHVTQNGDGKLKIKRGHHRFAAAKELGLPVWYVVDNDSMSIYEWEGDTRQTWSLADFIVSYANGGSEDCKALLEFGRKYDIPFRVIVPLLGGESIGSNNKMKLVRLGKYKVDNSAIPHTLEIVNTINFLREQDISFAGQFVFLVALDAAYRIPEFDPSIFKTRIKSNPRMMKRRNTRDGYLEEIENVYNYMAKTNRLPVKARAIEECRKRSAVNVAVEKKRIR